MRAARSRPRISRGRLYDVVSALTRVGVGWMFVEHGLDMRGRTDAVSARLPDPGSAVAGVLSPALPALLVALSVAFAVGLLTWLTGPLLAATAILGALAVGGGGPPDLAPFGPWPTTVLVTAVCVLMAVSGGRWSWDHLVLSSGRTGRRPGTVRAVGPATARAPAFSRRLPEHAPPLLYPVGEAAFRRPSRL
ncbi:DoxX family protein [Nocardiopsis sp. NPDC050513]|uniref:DoxX family protein n=1 Tax=Nocardiopsis sp. NPDC050513 TaxID=3364338 RepID=UPI0037985A86